MSTSDLAPAGSSTYSSNTLHVGDGTWDNGRDTFLLPNLEGLNFQTMQYNGMGNRFKNLPGYYQLILGHGILAAIVFLLVVPSAVFMAKFYRGDPRTAVKTHVYLQILTVFLLTVVFILGFFAVGPERSLTNPHHGIGVAIYVLVLAQFIFGWLMSKVEKRRKNPLALTRIPKKVWVHKLLGRSIALLGVVQIALGLTLYGSPKVLFILFALAGAILIFGYIALDRVYYEERRVEWGVDGQPEFYSDYNSSYLSGTQTDLTQDQRRRNNRPPSRERQDNHWGRKILAGAGALGAYEAWKHKRERRREERYDEDDGSVFEQDRRHRPPPPEMESSIGPSGVPSRPSSRPPPGVMYGAGNVPMRPGSRPPPRSRQGRLPPTEDSRLSPESWEEEEKYSESQQPHTWRDRLLGAGAGIGAFAGVKSLFDRRQKRRDDEKDEYRRHHRPPLGGSQNMVSQTDISRVEAGDAPMSPPNARVAGVAPMTPSQTPSRTQGRPIGRPSLDSMSYDDEESHVADGAHHPPQHKKEADPHTLRNSIASLGAIAGFREWNKHRRERRERQVADRLRQEELDNEEHYNRRNSMNYPRPQDSHAGRRPSESGTLLTGFSGAAEGHHGFESSNPQLSRTDFGSRVDTSHPPLPATAGVLPSMSGAGAPSSFARPGASQQRMQDPYASGYQLPPPPPGPPPGGFRPVEGPGSLQMPAGAVNPDPNRLMSHGEIIQQSSGHAHPERDATAGALAGAAAANTVNRQRRNSQSQSPSRLHTRTDSRSRFGRRGSATSASMSQVDTSAGPSVGAPGPGSPPVSMKLQMHNDGRHVTLRRLSEEEAAAERAARRQERIERRSARRTRRGSSLSSGQESDAPPGSNARYRRNGGRHRMRDSSQQPIENVPPPPPSALSSAGAPGRRQSSELNLPAPPPVPVHSSSPQGEGLSPPAAPIAGSGMSGGVGSPGDAGTGTDLSTFDNNRRRRRAERARRLEAAQARGNRVEFE
ncbi:hypothetical protein B0A50_01627 [Salinomyces thailandicus]|uniref:Cytochrome b561 domain-containing protein n=1 Tax=Salinomyces thailandicus TaxID=706561 RepID=A0A4V5N6F8_9PEZI|nr:hypothetical protein B0A50_01627 [Salinomyces thailandica]